MTLHVDDDGFVRAPVGLVYPRLTHIGRWPLWWPGIQVHRLATADERWALRLDRDRWRGLRLVARPYGWSHDHGFRIELSGDLVGEWEVWLESTHGGTVVHHLAWIEPAGRPLPSLRTFRAVLRQGLWGLKDELHVEVRSAVDLVP